MSSTNGTTNIDDLPGPSANGGVGGGNNNAFLGNQTSANLNLELFDKNKPSPTFKEPLSMPEQKHEPGSNAINTNQNPIDIGQFVSSIQRASSEGALGLPQRDIPISQNHITQDQQIQANFIPSHSYPGGEGDYIKDHISKEEILRRASMNQSYLQAQDDVYTELQLPLLIFILYFIFNLPFVRKNIFTYFPLLFQKDGNLTGGGHLFNSITFSVICYGVFKGVKYLSA